MDRFMLSLYAANPCFIPKNKEAVDEINAPGTSYIRNLGYGGHRFAYYCETRFAWLLLTLVKLKVGVEHFQPGCKHVPKKKCKEIAKALKHLRDHMPQEYDEPDILFGDIEFWDKCDGATRVSLNDALCKPH